MRIFLDFEASSLGKYSYPIELAWIDEAGQAESHLIRPAPEWTDWDPAAEAIHGLARETLNRHGEDHAAVTQRVVDRLSGHDLHASAPSWDGKWLSTLLRAARLPRHTLRLRSTADALAEDAASILAEIVPAPALAPLIADLLKRTDALFEMRHVEHRAAGDAAMERERWLACLRFARKEAEILDLPQPASVVGAAGIEPATPPV